METLASEARAERGGSAGRGAADAPPVGHDRDRIQRGMEEALRRLEAGEDPDAVEAEMGDLLEGDQTVRPARRGQGGPAAEARPPRRDDTLYEM